MEHDALCMGYGAWAMWQRARGMRHGSQGMRHRITSCSPARPQLHAQLRNPYSHNVVDVLDLQLLGLECVDDIGCPLCAWVIQ
eukprot:290770-Chlamydomonas_euryale.AAC.4